MYLKQYIKKFGNLTFKERSFCDADAVILAAAVYTNLEVIAPSIHDEKSSQTTFNDISEFDMSIITAGRTLMFHNKKAIPLLKGSKRFGNIGIKYVYKVFNVDLANQFYACTYFVPDVGTVVAFRGTDITTAGWQENLNLSIKQVVFSQLDALDYLNLIAEKTEGPLYIVGHSKGGNLALYSSLHASKEIKDRLVKIYSLDGNGLKKDFNESQEYFDIKDKFKFICPYDTIVGTLMNTPNNRMVVKSKAFFVFQHDPYSWKINDDTGEFVTLPQISEKAYIRTVFFKDFLSKVSEEEKAVLITFIIEFLGGANKTIFDFFFHFGKTVRLIKMWKRLTPKQKDIVKTSIKKLKACKKQAKLARRLQKRNDN